MDHDAHFSETVLKQDSMTFLPPTLSSCSVEEWKTEDMCNGVLHYH